MASIIGLGIAGTFVILFVLMMLGFAIIFGTIGLIIQFWWLILIILVIKSVADRGK
jgi:hypothetical protein